MFTLTNKQGAFAELKAIVRIVSNWKLRLTGDHISALRQAMNVSNISEMTQPIKFMRLLSGFKLI